MKSGRIKSQSLLIKKQGFTPEVFNSVVAQPLRFWESDRTHILYPLEWSVSVPEKEIQFTFKPFLDDQEIPYVGPARAIWEGCGVVNGSFSGRLIKGTARLELYGYGYVFDIRKYMDTFIRRFDRHIENFFPRVIDEARLNEYLGKPRWRNEPEAYKDVLTGPIWDLMSREGKHWRPVFGVLFLESLGCQSAPYEPLLATMLELNHTGALIIDDIEDNSLLRRGEESIHLKYGNAVAINAGNTLYFLPYIQIWNHPYLNERQKFEIYRIMVKVWVRSHFGQSLDIYWSKYLSREMLGKWLDETIEEKILQMYSYKTASAVEAVAEAVCVIAKTDEEAKKAYMSLGNIFGTVFQIIDDINNFSDSKEWRKTCGEDLSAGKLTYVIARAMKNLPKDARERLIDIMTQETLRADQDCLREGIDLIRESGALDACRVFAQDMIEDEWRKFSKHVPPSDTKTMIRMLISGLTNIIYES